MANHRTKVNEIVGRCRRVGWTVEMGDGNSEWLFKIVCPPPHKPVYLHSSPSDVNWYRTTERTLKKAGLEAAEAEWEQRDAAERAAKLAADRKRAETKAATLAKQSKALVSAAGKYAGPQEIDLAWFSTPTQWQETKTVVMTPEVAQYALDKMNEHNRKRSDARVAYFVDVINNDEFRLTHQGISVSTEGELLDGQSRLEAIATTGKPAIVMVSVGMDPAIFPCIDTGGPRTAADTAYLLGEADPRTSSSTVKMLIAFDRHGGSAHNGSKVRIPNERVAKGLSEYNSDPHQGALHEAITRAREIKRSLRRANPSALATGIFLISRRLPKDDPRVTRFLDDLVFGLDGRRYGRDPVYLLRRMLLNGPSDARRYYNQWEQLALIIKAWNFRAAGETKQNLVWRRDNPFPATVFLPPPLAQDEAYREMEARAA